MDFERNNYPPFPPQEGPVPPPQPVPPAPPEPPRTLPPYLPYQPPPRRHSGWRIIWGILFALSVLANVGLFLLFLAVAVVAFGRSGTRPLEAVVREGPRDSKIVLVHVGGIIDGEQAEEVHRQISAAQQDPAVRGIILHVDSPGGTISASDQIYREMMDYRKQMGRPTVAFMQGMAASGGYYASVSCDEIIAEPTAVTGSIGVLMMHFVFQDLLENKLGIQPVFLTMGAKKDWPSAFRMPKDEELAYVRSRLLEPAYRRFVDVVKEGRKDALSAEEVEKLADGSIFCADEALAVKLIDKIGYLDDAIARAKTLAGVQRAQVVEYRKPLTLLGMLSARSKSPSILRIDRMKLLELGTPQVMYLWNAY